MPSAPGAADWDALLRRLDAVEAKLSAVDRLAVQMTQLTIRRTEKADMAKELAAFVGKAASTDTQSESDDFDENPAAPNA